MALPRVQLKNASHRDAFVNKLWEMVNNNVMTDVTLVSADGHTIPIHKLVLVTSSDYFRNMQREGNLDRHLLEFQGVTGSVMQELVRFMYTGSVYATYQSILQVHSAATQLGMSALVATCNVLIEQQISQLQSQVVEQQAAAGVQQGVHEQGVQQGVHEQGVHEQSVQQGVQEQSVQQGVQQGVHEQSVQQGVQQGVHEQSVQQCVQQSVQERSVQQDRSVEQASTGRILPGEIPDQPADNDNLSTSRTTDLKLAVTRPSFPPSLAPTLPSRPCATTSSESVSDHHGSTNYDDLINPLAPTDQKDELERNVSSKTSTPVRKRGRPRKEGSAKKKRVEEPEVAVPSTSSFKAYAQSDSDLDLYDDDLDFDYIPDRLAKRKRISTKRKSRRRSGGESESCPVVCTMCEREFRGPDRLKRHKHLFHSRHSVRFLGLRRALRSRRAAASCRCKKINGGYVCKDCGKFFTLKNSYRGHALISHKRREKRLLGCGRPSYYSCRECGRVYKHLSSWKRHSLLHGHHRERPTRKQTFPLQNEAKRTKRRKRLNPAKSYKKRGVLRRAQTTERPSICPVCRMTLPDTQTLAAHIYSDHDFFTFALPQDQFAFQCPDCTKLPRNYTSFNSIRTHCQKKHKYDLSTSCFYCNARLKSRAALAHHLHSAHRIKSTILKLDPLGKQYIYCNLLSMEAELPGSVRCHFCRKVFYDDSELFSHLASLHYQYCDYKRLKSNPKRQKVDSYSCGRCGVIAYNAQEMQEHFVEKHATVRKHNRTEEKSTEVCGSYRCREEGCYVETDEEWGLIKHMETDHPKVSYRCEKCPYKSCLYYQYLQHRGKHEGSYVCDLCGKFCRKSPMLKYHKWKVHGISDGTVTVFRCGVEGCHFECHQKCALNQHQAKHDPDKPFSCPQCGRLLKTQKSLESHISRMHMGIRPYVCEICGKSFPKPGEIKAHMKTHAENTMPCDHCKFTTANKYSLISHLLSRHGIQVRQHEKLHQCPYCEYKTMRSKHLQNHVNSHLNKRDFICDLCGKSFISASSLKGHHNWVHAEKAFKCDFCNYKGGALSNLKQHVRVMHTLRGLKPYKCFYCDFRCELSGNCRVHCRSAHKGMEVKWVKVVDFKSELPNKEEAEEIKLQEAERKKELESQRHADVKALERQKLKNVAPALTSGAATLDDDQGQIKTLLKTVTNEWENMERENQSQQQQQQRQLLPQQELPRVLSRSLATTASGLLQQQQQQQQLFTDDPFQHPLIYMSDSAIPNAVQTRTTYYTTTAAAAVYDSPQPILTTQIQQQQQQQQIFHGQHLYAQPNTTPSNSANNHNLFTDESLTH